MKTFACRTIPCMLIMALCVSGCAGFVGGDLRNTKSDYRMPTCKNASANYQVIYKSDAKDDNGGKNISGFITSLTLGLIPTYWTITVHSEAIILQNGSSIFSRKYTSRIHEFY